jgi:hypothetical protein
MRHFGNEDMLRDTDTSSFKTSPKSSLLRKEGAEEGNNALWETLPSFFGRNPES